jgi:hypothetical protein
MFQTHNILKHTQYGNHTHTILNIVNGYCTIHIHTVQWLFLRSCSRPCSCSNSISLCSSLSLSLCSSLSLSLFSYLSLSLSHSHSSHLSHSHSHSSHLSHSHSSHLTLTLTLLLLDHRCGCGSGCGWHAHSAGNLGLANRRGAAPTGGGTHAAARAGMYVCM